MGETEVRNEHLSETLTHAANIDLLFLFSGCIDRLTHLEACGGKRGRMESTAPTQMPRIWAPTLHKRCIT